MSINITKLMNRNFTLMVIGQIISLFGNSILRFSLSLYVLDTTGSATIFASILAISVIPTILLAPIGGILADRVSRKHIMLVLDFLTSFLILIFSLFVTGGVSILMIAFVLILLSIIQACYQPSVQASIPLLTSDVHLMQANGIVVQVNALANLLGPILSGILYSILPFSILLWIASFAFFASAILECIMKIPFTRLPKTKHALSMALQDIKDGMHFIIKQQPILFRLLLVLALLNLVFSSFLMVALPVISNIILKLPATFYGWLQAGTGIGTIIGSLCIPIYNKRFDIKSSYLLLLFSSLCLLPLAISLLFQQHVLLCYTIVLLSSVCAMGFATIFNIIAQTLLQQMTPNELLGKVSSFVSMIVMCSYPIGQALYGVLFDVFKDTSYCIVLLTCVLSILISIQTKKYLKAL